MGSHRDQARSAVGRNAIAGGGNGARPAQAHPAEATSQVRADVAKFFFDLRRTIGASAPQAAQQLKTSVSVIAALERADVSELPPWVETQRIVMGYADWAGIDGRPVLTALGILAKEAEQRRLTAQQAAAVRPAVNASSERLRQVRLALADGARRLPMEAYNHARERPVRTFYALSMPLALLLLTLHPHFFRDVGSVAYKPFKSAVVSVGDMWAVSFAPRREGLKWIEFSDPRRRRSDKIEPNG